MKINYHTGDLVRAIQPIYEYHISGAIPKGEYGTIVEASWNQTIVVHFSKYNTDVYCNKGSIKLIRKNNGGLK